jgi:tRNA G10  N-methylase Trm11
VWGLLQVEQIPETDLDPCCGTGTITMALRETGRTVYAADITSYGCPDARGGVDFLLTDHLPVGVEAIVFNPPYKSAAQIVEHALRLGVPLIVALLRLSFLESERRTRILDGGKLARVHVFKSRLPMRLEGTEGDEPDRLCLVRVAAGAHRSHHRRPHRYPRRASL